MPVSTEKEYFYKVREINQSFNKPNPDITEVDFKGNDLMECRRRATHYFGQTLSSLKELTSNTSTVTLCLIEVEGNESFNEYVVAGEDLGLVTKGQQIEHVILSSLGYIPQ